MEIERERDYTEVLLYISLIDGEYAHDNVAKNHRLFFGVWLPLPVMGGF